MRNLEVFQKLSFLWSLARSILTQLLPLSVDQHKTAVGDFLLKPGSSKKKESVQKQHMQKI
jgi:hypothetical protein